MSILWVSIPIIIIVITLLIFVFRKDKKGQKLDTPKSNKSSRRNFLSSLNAKEKVAVSNLNPITYKVVIKEKMGEDAPTVISGPGTVDINLLKKLTVEELESLCESAECGQKADSFADRGDLVNAAKCYREAFELNPYNDLALLSYGVALAQQGNLREGIKWVQKALDVNPDSERIRNNLSAMKAEL